MKLPLHFQRHSTLSAVALVFGLSAVASSALAQQGTVTFASWGGAFQDSLRKAFIKPAEEKLNIKIKEDTTNGIADIRSQINAKAVTWDIKEDSLDVCAQLKSEGSLEPLDYSQINTTGIPPELVNSHWIGFVNFTKVIAWRTEKFGPNGPKNFADFWDVKKFPGKRSMYAKVNYALEAATMADGVPPEKVYQALSTPAGVEKAFKKMEEIAPHITVWYRGGSQSAQLLKDGEVDIIHMGVNRVEAVKGDGAKVAYTFNQGTMDVDCVLVPRGAPNKQLAMKVINEFVDAKNQAQIAKLIPIGPVNTNAFKTGILTEQEIAANNTAPANYKLQLLVDPAVYAGRLDKLQERYDALIQRNK